MKRFGKFLAIALVSMFTLGNAYAQDLGEATEIYNNAATALNEDRAAEALEGFQKALSLAEAAGEEGAQLAADCKGIIPKILMKLGKEAAAAKDMDTAVAKMQEAAAKATEYGDAATAAEAKEFIPMIYLTEGNALLNAKQFAEAIAEYEKVITLDPDNGMAYLRIGMCKANTGDADGAIEALTKASELGQSASAAKQLGTIYAKKAQAAYKAKDNQATLDNVLKAKEFGYTKVNLYGGMAAFNLKKYDEAIELLEGDASMNAKYYLARAYEAKGNNAKACEYYKQITTDKNFGAYATSKVSALCK